MKHSKQDLFLTTNSSSASPASLVFSSFSPSLTTSEDEVDEAELKGSTARVAGRTRWGRLGAVKEDGGSEEDDDEVDGDDDDDGVQQGNAHIEEDMESSKKLWKVSIGDKEGSTLHCKKHVNGKAQTVIISEDVKKEKNSNISLQKEANSDNELKLRAGSDSDGCNSEDSELGPWRYKDFGKDFEPLKSVQLLRNLEKNLSTYLPVHSIGSDTETSEP